MIFKIYQSKKNSLYYFQAIKGNGRILMSSQGYKAKQSTKIGISSVVNNITLAHRFLHHSKKNGQVWFQLKAGNGEVIADSQVYPDQGSMQRDIKYLMKGVPKASIIDLTKRA